MKFKELFPIQKFIYPNSGGYLGFSIFIWHTRNAPMSEYTLRNEWGGPEGARELNKSEYVLEARFFVYGSLLKRHLLSEKSFEEAMKRFDELKEKWIPIMDKIIERERKIEEENKYSGIHIDQVVDGDILINL